MQKDIKKMNKLQKKPTKDKKRYDLFPLNRGCKFEWGIIHAAYVSKRSRLLKQQ